MEKQSRSSNITEETSSTPSFSSCSSEFEFEFTISHSPNNNEDHHFCTADEIFYKGKLLPLHHSPRLIMLRNLHLSSAITSDSQFSTLSDCDSSRLGSVTEDDKFINFNHNLKHPSDNFAPQVKKNKFLSSFSTCPSVFCTKREKNCKVSCTRMSGISARDAIRKFMKKLKHLFEEIGTFSVISTKYAVFVMPIKTDEYENKQSEKKLSLLCKNGGFSDSFSGKFMRVGNFRSRSSSSISSSPIRSCKESSSVEEKQSAIQSAIAHCKNSMLVSSDSSN